MKDHIHFEELTALSASGLLSADERSELRQHTATCADCRIAETELIELVQFHMPLTVSPLREFRDRIQTKSDGELRTRFIQRARREGITFSPAVESSSKRRMVPLGWFGAAAGACAALLIVAAFLKIHADRLTVARQAPESQKLIDQLKAENAALALQASQLNQSNATQQQEINKLRIRIGSSDALAETSQRTSQRMQSDLEQSIQGEAALRSEIQDREKLLASAQSELARIKEEDSSNQASLVTQQTRINELSDQLRIANADLALERQLASAGKDVRELMGARQLHVVDVRDSDPTGAASKPFGRVFLTEGKSLIFYAFDLSDTKVASAKRAFEVWGEQQGKKGSTRSLGFLFVDDKAQRRWALKVDNPNLIAEIDSVFVTIETPGQKKEPTGQRMLYAYLGEANHP